MKQNYWPVGTDKPVIDGTEKQGSTSTDLSALIQVVVEKTQKY